jgi:osmotically-inducible protein OsmY
MLRALNEQVTDHYELLECDPARLVGSRLRRSGYPFLRGIKCEVHDGVTVLSGSVPTFHLKQVAQEIAAHTKGVRLIENRVHVTNSTYRLGRSTAAG